jgi:CRISPR-associated protein Csx17
MTGDHIDLELAGCTPEPLMAYLKALGILRLVSEQKDPEARGWWKHDVFWLRAPVLFKDAGTTEDKRETLAKFFLEEYEPTPILVPWSGADFFKVNWGVREPRYTKTPTASKVIEAVLATKTNRLASYRGSLRCCKAVLEKCGIDAKEKMERDKWRFIGALRAVCEEAGVIDWIDAAAVITIEKFAALLGSGGGSDGNTHFSDNFMQNLWDALPDFDEERGLRRGNAARSVSDVSRRQLKEALFFIPCQDRIAKRTSSLFDSGAVGGPNATQGMERESLSNPWNVILALEGVVSFAGAATKRLAASAAQGGAFPFQVSASVTTEDGLADKEQAGAEVWLPLWNRPARCGEVIALLREGRAECGPRPARTGVDMARAIASLGVDRGVQTFIRYAIVKGRVGGENYNTAAVLGRFDVVERGGADLLREVDRWLDDFRWKCARGRDKEEAPKRILSALTGIDSAIFKFCKYGGPRVFQEIVIALGKAEHKLAVTEGKFNRKTVNPVPRMSSAWMDAANDGSPEFAIARALASIYDPEARIGPLRANLEPVCREERCVKWAEKDRAVVWNAADLAINLAHVLERRVLDGQRAMCTALPLASDSAVSLDTIAAFLDGELDDQRIEDLLWGLILIERRGGLKLGRPVEREEANDRPMPRTYALLKLLFLPRPLVGESQGERIRWRLAHAGEAGIVIRPEPRVLPLLRAGRIGEACRIAAQRLRVSGLPPIPGTLPDGRIRDETWSEFAGNPRLAQRLAGSLLIPIDSASVNRLVHLVCRSELVLVTS